MMILSARAILTHGDFDIHLLKRVSIYQQFTSSDNLELSVSTNLWKQFSITVRYFGHNWKHIWKMLNPVIQMHTICLCPVCWASQICNSKIYLLIKKTTCSYKTVHSGRQWCRGRASASHIKGPWFESRDERVLTLEFFHTIGASTG